MTTNNILHDNEQIEPVKDLRKPSFWLLHLIGWTVYWFLFVIENTIITAKGSSGSSFLIALPLFVSASLAFVLTVPLRYVYQRSWQLSMGKLLSVIIAGCVIVSLIWTPTKNMSMWFFMHYIEGKVPMSEAVEGGVPFLYHFNSIVYSLAMILAWSTLYFSINYYYRLQAEKELHLAAVRLSHSAQIKMLRYQINPHFLFNTLNAISTLVLTGNKEKANGMLVRLSTFLRFSLDNDPEKKVALYDELKALMLYLEIEKTRFDDRLSVHFDVTPEAENLLVPSLLLQPLVENSIKYAIAKMVKDGEIQISARVVGNRLCLSVADNGPDASEILVDNKLVLQEDRNGVGIRNIKERLRVLYPNVHKFTMRRNELNGLCVMIEIPTEAN
ncbi:sensor histidine kinase [Glaciecola sp. KUL10]|uniref:sensor histidine kinase n=1 Tax=Glaciecola sp. (strain KUL10) TaxID=2161813 RepID=UPI000D7877CE|nr:histidine kinase [Glaciecola sp. KUL10]GBL05581.1 signal transduction histidine kinase, LytS [Glaciecola sp. KUL10]